MFKLGMAICLALAIKTLQKWQVPLPGGTLEELAMIFHIPSMFHDEMSIYLMMGKSNLGSPNEKDEVFICQDGNIALPRCNCSFQSRRFWSCYHSISIT